MITQIGGLASPAGGASPASRHETAGSSDFARTFAATRNKEDGPTSGRTDGRDPAKDATEAPSEADAAPNRETEPDGKTDAAANSAENTSRDTAPKANGFEGAGDAQPDFSTSDSGISGRTGDTTADLAAGAVPAEVAPAQIPARHPTAGRMAAGTAATADGAATSRSTPSALGQSAGGEAMSADMKAGAAKPHLPAEGKTGTGHRVDAVGTASGRPPTSAGEVQHAGVDTTRHGPMASLTPAGAGGGAASGEMAAKVSVGTPSGQPAGTVAATGMAGDPEKTAQPHPASSDASRTPVGLATKPAGPGMGLPSAVGSATATTRAGFAGDVAAQDRTSRDLLRSEPEARIAAFPVADATKPDARSGSVDLAARGVRLFAARAASQPGLAATALPGSVTAPFISEPGRDSGPLDYAAAAAPEGRAMPTATIAGQAPLGRADNAAVLRQIAESMTRFTNGSVDIRLNPEELGRVRLQMVPGESGLMVHVQADRPETLDLLRRHIDQLARDLAAAGHDAAGFTFGREGNDAARSGGTAPENPDAVASAPPDIPDAPPSDRLAATPDGSIDIRL